MKNFNFYSPTEFVFGKGRENEVGKYVKKYGGRMMWLQFMKLPQDKNNREKYSG